MAKSAADEVFDLQRKLNKLKEEINGLSPEQLAQRVKELRKAIGNNESAANTLYNIMRDQQHRIEMAMDALRAMNDTRRNLRVTLR